MAIQILPDTVRALLERPVITFLATAYKDGQPQVTPVWIDLEGDRPVFNTTIGNVKERHLRRDPRLSLAFTNPDNPYEYVEIRGTAAEFTTDGAVEMINRLSKKYIDQDPYPWLQPGQQRVTVFVNPTHVSGTGV